MVDLEAVTTFVHVAAYQAPWGSFNKRCMTVESNSWTTLLVLRLPSSGNVSARYCWNGSMLIVFGSFILARFYNRSREGDWSVALQPWCVRAKPSMIYDPAFSAHAGPLSNRIGRLIDPLSDSACHRPVLNRADQFIIRWTVNKRVNG